MDSLSGKKILLIITKSNWGGAQAYVYSLARNMRRNGAEVVVALGGTGLPGAETGLLAERLRQENIKTIVLSSFARDISFGREVRALQELRRTIHDEKPDIIHLNSSKAGGLGALAGRLEHVQHIIYTAHGWAHREPRDAFKRLMILISSWFTITLCHKVIVVSKRDYDDAPVFTKSKIVLIHNGIESFSILPKEESRNAISKKYGVPGIGVWILMQAELHKNKGIRIAIEAFAQLCKEKENVYLVIMGEGEERQPLEAVIYKFGLNDKVFLLGFLPNSRSYLAAGDMFLMTSYKEGLPMAILEAGFAHLPVIASNTGGIPEIIRDSETGILVSPGDVRGFYVSLLKLMNDPSSAKKYGDALHMNIKLNFSEEKMSRETISVYLKTP